jgi:5-methylcytosine-specific restriction endonuclease McrA
VEVPLLKRPCLECGAPIEGRDRCPGCDPRPPYDWAWQQMAKTQIAREPWCAECGHTGSRANPLTADHVRPLIDGGRHELSNLQTLCRQHNSAKGAGRRKNGQPNPYTSAKGGGVRAGPPPT